MGRKSLQEKLSRTKEEIIGAGEYLAFRTYESCGAAIIKAEERIWKVEKAAEKVMRETPEILTSTAEGFASSAAYSTLIKSADIIAAANKRYKRYSLELAAMKYLKAMDIAAKGSDMQRFATAYQKMVKNCKSSKNFEEHKKAAKEICTNKSSNYFWESIQE